MSGDICLDNRFEVISRAKRYMIEATNIECAKDETACLDSFLFRCWQLGFLERFEAEVNGYKGLTFGQAFYYLVRGKKIRRPTWHPKVMLTIRDGKLYVPPYLDLEKDTLEMNAPSHIVQIEEVMEDDWEVVE
jgi:hypothetical protein